MMLRKCIGVLALGALLDTIGCAGQKIRHYEYYEPTESTAFKREDGLTVGAIKTEYVREGAPDWSDEKSISLISVGK